MLVVFELAVSNFAKSRLVKEQPILTLMNYKIERRQEDPKSTNLVSDGRNEVARHTKFECDEEYGQRETNASWAIKSTIVYQYFQQMCM